MNIRLVTSYAVFASITLAGSINPAQGFEIKRTKTEVEVLSSAVGALPAVGIDFTGGFTDAGFPELARQDLVVGWQEVGGVQPEPFRVGVPAGCFVQRDNGYVVKNYAACGVEILLNDSGEEMSLPIDAFDAKVIVRDDGTAIFKIGAEFRSPAGAAPVLERVGGSELSVVIGREMQTSPALRAATVSGIEPQPF